MKEERMTILSMLEKGIITADEAERLLATLNNGVGLEKDGIGKAVGGVLGKAGAALSAVADKVKENPAVKSAATKVAEKAEDLQPAVRSAAFRMAEKASELKEDMATYREKLKERKGRDAAEARDDTDLEGPNATETDVAEGKEIEKISPEMNKYLNKVEDVLDDMGEQMEQLNDMESFLTAAFGEYDPSEWEDDEEEQKEAKKEEKKEEKAD